MPPKGWKKYRTAEDFYRVEASGIWRKFRAIFRYEACPIDLREKYMSSDIWYQRLTACLSGSSTRLTMKREYVSRALADIDVRVRKAAYNEICMNDYHPDVVRGRTQLILDKKARNDNRYNLLAVDWEDSIEELISSPELALLHPEKWVRDEAAIKLRGENA